VTARESSVSSMRDGSVHTIARCYSDASVSDHYDFEGARPDLIRGSLQSCYVIEHARRGVQRTWGGPFDADAQRTAQRIDRLGRLLDERGIRRPDEVIAPHSFWLESVCGSAPDEVPLGSAVLHTFGRWSDVFAAPYMGDDSDEFRALGAEHARVDLEYRSLFEDEAILEPPAHRDGRRFVILTDLHVGSTAGNLLAPLAVSDINELAPEFVVIPGDVTDDGEPEQFRLVKEILDGLRCPYYVVPGNHDAVQRSTRGEVGAKLFAEAFGFEPDDRIVEIGDLQIALVDSTDPTASPFPDWDVSTARVGGIAAGVDSGALAPGQADALAARLDRTRPVLLVQHHELHPFPGFPPVRFAMREEDAAAELAALRDHNLVGVVAGHTHRSAVLEVGERLTPQLEIPSLKDWPYTFAVCTLDDDGLHVDVRQVSDRGTVWSVAKALPPLATRFMIGPLSNLSYTFTL
jgi:predicted phosphodiesterase